VDVKTQGVVRDMSRCVEGCEFLKLRKGEGLNRMWCDLYEQILAWGWAYIPGKDTENVKNKTILVNRCDECIEEDRIYSILKDLEHETEGME
jgi:hypothetical protein